MAHSSQLKLSVGALSLIPLLAGCGPLIIAYPPVPTHGTELSGLDRGEIAAATGGNFFVASVPGELAEELAPDLLAGAWVWSAGSGLGRGWDVRLSSGLKLQGLNWNLQVGKDLRRWEGGAEVGALIGLGGSYNTGAWSEDTEDGQTIEHDYRYGTLVPSLGARAAFPITDRLWVPVGARLSWSQIVPGAGVSRADVYGVLWIEARSGFLLKGDHLGLSLDLDLLSTPTEEGELPFGVRAGISVQGSLDAAKGKPRR